MDLLASSDETPRPIAGIPLSVFDCLDMEPEVEQQSGTDPLFYNAMVGGPDLGGHKEIVSLFISL